MMYCPVFSVELKCFFALVNEFSSEISLSFFSYLFYHCFSHSLFSLADAFRSRAVP